MSVAPIAAGHATKQWPATILFGFARGAATSGAQARINAARVKLVIQKRATAADVAAKTRLKTTPPATGIIGKAIRRKLNQARTQ